MLYHRLRETFALSNHGVGLKSEHLQARVQAVFFFALHVES